MDPQRWLALLVPTLQTRGESTSKQPGAWDCISGLSNLLLSQDADSSPIFSPIVMITGTGDYNTSAVTNKTITTGRQLTSDAAIED